MKRRTFLVCSAALFCSAFLAGGCTQKTSQPVLQQIEYSNLADSDTQALLSKLLQDAGVSDLRIQTFFDHVQMMICVTYILQQIYGAMISMGTYYATYILGNQNLFGVFSWAINIPLIIALVFTPTLVAKWNGMYKLNVMSYTLATISRALVAVAGYMGSGNVTLMLLFTAIAALGQGPWQGDMNAAIAACSEYTWLTKHKRVDGTMYSCTSLGVKLGGGLGTAITGWLLAASHFDSALTVQPDSCINMLKIMYLVIPFALDAIITFILSRMKVEEANEKLRAAV